MQLKFPETILIGDNIFEIKLDPSKGGAEFVYWDLTKEKEILSPSITIGTKYLKSNPLIVFSSIIHELKEIINCDQFVRHTTNDSSIQFHYTHNEHNDMCARLAGLLTYFLEDGVESTTTNQKLKGKKKFKGGN